MKVKDLLPLDIDIDIANSVTDDLWPAFCGPQALTPEGTLEFADVLDMEITEIDAENAIAVVDVDAPGELWKHHFKRARIFFCAAAGYCAAEDYDKWFLLE